MITPETWARVEALKDDQCVGKVEARDGDLIRLWLVYRDDKGFLSLRLKDDIFSIAVVCTDDAPTADILRPHGRDR